MFNPLTNKILEEFDERFSIGKDQSPTRLTSPSWKEWVQIKSFLSQALATCRQETIKEEREAVKKMVEEMGIEEGMTNQSGKPIDPETLMQIKHDTDYVRMGYEAAKKEIIDHLTNPNEIK